jgi:hypothetical protein
VFRWETVPEPEILRPRFPCAGPSKVKVTRTALPAGVELVTLQIRSANAWLGPWLPSLKGKLVGVASAWPEFITTARTMLIAAGLDAETIIYRDVRKPRWSRGLETDQRHHLRCPYRVPPCLPKAGQSDRLSSAC